MRRIIRALCLLFLMRLPGAVRTKLLRLLFGWQVDPRAKIGISFIDVGHLELGRNSRIGSLNVIKGLERLVLKEDASIASFNWISGYPKGGASFRHAKDRNPSLLMLYGSAITSRHLVDCTDQVSIGALSTVAGFRSQILTHSIDITRNIQDCAPVNVGAGCFVGTGSIVLKGVTICPNSVIGAGSVVNKNLTEEFGLYAGTPASLVKKLDAHSAYFTRQRGEVA